MAATNEPQPPASPPLRRRTWPLIALIFAAFWIVYLIVAGPSPVDDLDLPGPGTVVGYEWTLEGLDGAPVSFADFRGKPLFVNIWATWCPPCIEEMPSIARLASYPGLRDAGVAFLCIATDESVEDVRRFVRGKGWPMTFLRARTLPAALLTDGLPATFLVAPDGKIAYRRDGGADWDTPEVYKKLRELAATPPKAEPDAASSAARDPA